MSKTQSIKQRIDDYVIPTYSRFDLILTHGEGCHVFDADGKRYLDLGAGIATGAARCTCLGIYVFRVALPMHIPGSWCNHESDTFRHITLFYMTFSPLDPEGFLR